MQLLNGIWRPAKQHAPSGGGGGGGNLWKMDFQSMTETGPSFLTGSPNGQTATDNTWSTGVVVTDPLAVHDQVLGIHYQNDPSAGFVDDNKSVAPSPLTLNLGEELWFQGDVALDATARMDFGGPGTVQRKLLYWGPANLESGPLGFSLVVSTFGPQFFINKYPNSGQNNPSFNPEWPYPMYLDPANPAMSAGAWRTIKVYIRVNSTFAAIDGIVRIWVDGTLYVDQTQVSWTDPTVWAGHDPSEFQFTNFGIGYQVDSGGGGVAVDEMRYWDNLSFSRTEAGL